MAKPEIQFVGPVVDRRPKKPRNGYGRWGLFLPFVSCGLLAPLGLLLSMRGLFSRPRTSAVFGTLINGAICLMVGLPLGIEIAEKAHRHHRRVEAHRAQQHEQDRAAVSVTINDAQSKIGEYYTSHQVLPDGISGNKLIHGFVDAWEQPLRYDAPMDVNATSYAIRSAGRDHKFETRDDIKVEFTAGSRNDAAIPTTTPTESEPLGQSLNRIEVLDRSGRKYVVVINR